MQSSAQQTTVDDSPDVFVSAEQIKEFLLDAKAHFANRSRGYYEWNALAQMIAKLDLGLVGPLQTFGEGGLETNRKRVYQDLRTAKKILANLLQTSNLPVELQEAITVFFSLPKSRPIQAAPRETFELSERVKNFIHEFATHVKLELSLDRNSRHEHYSGSTSADKLDSQQANESNERKLIRADLGKKMWNALLKVIAFEKWKLSQEFFQPFPDVTIDENLRNNDVSRARKKIRDLLKNRTQDVKCIQAVNDVFIKIRRKTT